MTIAWQILNKISYPQDARFSKNILIISPNLTVKKRLQVLYHSDKNNYYERHKIVPHDLMLKLRQGNIRVHNWHVLMWDDEETLAKRKTVDKRGAKSDEAYVREVLREMSRSRNILVINDEAHHAWRNRQEDKIKGVDRKEQEMATCWIRGLDRINKARGILTCFDFSATPFSPSGTRGRRPYKEDLFPWIISDFGLMDAIEAGLTKTPRFVVRDDGSMTKDFKSKLYHIYEDEDVKQDLNRRKAEAHEILPDLVSNAYWLLGLDWQKTLEEWEKQKMDTPPVMISAVNKTDTANRVARMFTGKRIAIDELCDRKKLC